ncbi:MAG: YobA family protein [Turicibacter sp.]|nr:YobA family protein [Turicibacter sp.]
MKKWVISGCLLILLLVGCWVISRSQQPITFKGTVLQVSENTVLLSQRTDIEAADFSKTYDEWINGDYDLISVSNIDSVDVGAVLSVTIDGAITMSNLSIAQAKSYEVVDQIPMLAEETELPTLLGLFPTTVGMNQLFNGYAEYGHFQVLKSVQELDDKVQLVFDGMMADGQGESKERTFQIMYEITEQEVIEHVMNEDPYNVLKDSSLLNSIIPNKVLLKQPLEVGNQWTETFTYQGTSYTALTEIVEVEPNKDGKLTYQTVTTVEDMEGDCTGVYKEVRTFTTGSGMVSFSSFFSPTPVEEDEEVESLENIYFFGYSLSSENLKTTD